jgi:hypothetical protein
MFLEFQNRELECHLPYPINLEQPSTFASSKKYDYDDPHVKAFLLFQAHLSRFFDFESTDYHSDKISVLDQSIRVIQAMIDFSVHEGFLKTTLGVIKLLQCTKQAMWDNQSTLLMLPHLKAKDLQSLKLNNKSISNVSELFSLEHRQLKNTFGKLSSLSNSQLSDIVNAVKNLPYITLEFEIEGLKDKEGRWYMKPETVYKIQILITPKSNGNTQIHTPYFHKSQNEGWFVIIGNESSDEIWALRRTASESRLKDRSLKTWLNFTSPQYLGQHDFNIFAHSDGYCEFNFQIPLKIAVI